MATKTAPPLESSSVQTEPTSPARAENPALVPEQAPTALPGDGKAIAPAPAPGQPVDISHSCHTEQLGDLMAALARAQVRLRGALKDAQNPHLRNRYADLASVWNAWQEVGPAEGLALMQPAEAGSAFVTVHTHLGHSSGQWMRSTLKLPWEQQKGITPAQAIGSALTYARRYALASLVGVCPEDDDGNAAGVAENQPQTRPNGVAKTNGSRHPAAERAAAQQNGNGVPLKLEVTHLLCDVCGVRNEDDTWDLPSTMLQAAVYLPHANTEKGFSGCVPLDAEGKADLKAATEEQLLKIRDWLKIQKNRVAEEPF